MISEEQVKRISHLENRTAMWNSWAWKRKHFTLKWTSSMLCLQTRFTVFAFPFSFRETLLQDKSISICSNNGSFHYYKIRRLTFFNIMEHHLIGTRWSKFFNENCSMIKASTMEQFKGDSRPWLFMLGPLRSLDPTLYEVFLRGLCKRESFSSTITNSPRWA